MEKMFETLLQKAGYKVTPARIAILSLFEKECIPLRAHDVYEKLNTKINRVTAYRTLESLEKAGILKRVDLHKEAVHYERTSHHHHHIVCTDCGRIEKFDACNIEIVSKKALISSEYFTSIGQHSLEFFSVCTVCSKK